MRNKSCLLFCWFVLLVIFSGCSFSKVSYRDLSDISDKRLGILKGILTEEPLAVDYPQASVQTYSTLETALNLSSRMTTSLLLKPTTACTSAPQSWNFFSTG